jgi:hypothetical protein
MISERMTMSNYWEARLILRLFNRNIIKTKYRRNNQNREKKKLKRENLKDNHILRHFNR